MTRRHVFTRREFLKASGAAAGAAIALAPSVAAPAQEAQPARPFRYSTSTIMYPDSPLPVAIEEIAKAGCHAVDVWEGNAETPLNHMRWVWKNRPERLRELIESFGLKLYAFSIYWSPANERLQRLEWLKEAGGEVAVLGGGAGVDQPVAAGIAALQPLVEKAEELGIKIAGENHAGTSLNSIASLREFAALAESPALGLALAPYHVMAADESVPEAIRAVGSKLYFFYAWQHAPGLRELPGDGTLDFLPVLRALRDVEYESYLSIFTHTRAARDEMTAAIIASREYLERLADQIGGES